MFVFAFVESVLSAQSHLMWKTQRDIFRVAEVADFVENNWHLLCVDEVRDPGTSAGARKEDGVVQLVEKDKKDGKWRDSFVTSQAIKKIYDRAFFSEIDCL